MPNLSNVGRFPDTDPRLRRLIDQLTRSVQWVASNGALQFVNGVLTFVIRPGEPLSQDSTGISLVLDSDGGLEVTGGQLRIDQAEQDHLDWLRAETASAVADHVARDSSFN